MPKNKRRTSVSRYLSRVVDATEDFVDDMLESADDLECDVRHSLSKALDCKDDWDDDDDWDDWDDPDDGWDDWDDRPRGAAGRAQDRRRGPVRKRVVNGGRRPVRRRQPDRRREAEDRRADEEWDTRTDRAGGTDGGRGEAGHREVERLRAEVTALAEKIAELATDRG